MSDIVNSIIKNSNNQIKYRNTILTGEITVDNGDGTYNVKIANASSAYPDVETVNYDDVFSVGEIVDMIYEYGNKESPKILGHSKKIKQDPVEVEVDYSSEEGGGLQTIEKTLYCTGASGTITANEDTIDYNKLHNSLDGSDLYRIDIYTDGIYIAQVFNGIHNYAIERGFLFFDTSAIPAGATITSAILYLYAPYKSVTTDFNVVIQDGQPNYPHSPLINGDYYYANYRNNGGQKAISDFTLNSYNAITLNSNGLAWINKGGITKICLRSSQDIAKTAPTDTTSWINIIASEIYEGKSDFAKITITYTI